MTRITPPRPIALLLGALLLGALPLGAGDRCRADERLPPPRAEARADENANAPAGPVPVLFPPEPFPPPAPAVVDPRTGAWEQIHNPAAAHGPAPAHGVVPPPACMGLHDLCWQLRTRPRGACTICLFKNARTGAWEGSLLDHKP